MNYVSITGKVANLRKITINGELAYQGKILSERYSKIVDQIPFISYTLLEEGKFYAVKGKLKTRNFSDSYGVSHKRTFIEIENCMAAAPDTYDNYLKFEGYLVTKEAERMSPFGRIVRDIVVVINESKFISYYPSCICWESTSKLIEDIPIGSKIKITGRFQSREYQKRIPNSNSIQNRIAYEISCARIKQVTDDDSCSN